ncbi:MAG: hypothetical protein VW709_11055, partial [Rickettsiales bacterium]
VKPEEQDQGGDEDKKQYDRPSEDNRRHGGADQYRNRNFPTTKVGGSGLVGMQRRRYYHFPAAIILRFAVSCTVRMPELCATSPSARYWVSSKGMEPALPLMGVALRTARSRVLEGA